MREHVRFPIAAKFGVMLAVLVVALFAVGVAGVTGLSSLNGHVRSLYGDHIITLQRTTALAGETNHAAKIALQLVASNDPAEIAGLEAQLNRAVVPNTNSDLEALRVIHAHDPAAERARVATIASLWSRFISMLDAGALRALVGGASAIHHDESLARALRAIFDPIEEAVQREVHVEAAQSAVSAQQAADGYSGSRRLVILIGIAAIVLGLGVMALLVRAVVPRIRRYSAFATRVAGGETNGGLGIEGNDELSDLGTALNEMVSRRIAERVLEGHQAEFAEVMQLTESEDEAHTLLKHQIERLVAGSDVVTLNRNNSADRLQATTEIPAESPLLGALEGAKPRSCLAVRFARTHAERPDAEPLVSCEICGKTGAYSTCEPLLVGGEVIGSVLASRSHEFSDADSQTIRQAVTQAAPVLGNLRNLAIAELRAATDALTGLPNNRNVADTVKRMVAQASRTVAPLAALALDLDHFKQINDTHGHGVGDEVLAAVGSALTDAIRASDFVGRAGGEEFLILLPETGIEPAQVAAENLRVAIEAIVLPSLGRAITASIGIAVFPDQAGDAASLLRHADRALYTAKKNGRNRVESFVRGMLPSDPADAHMDEDPAASSEGVNGHANRAPSRRRRASSTAR